MSIESTRRYARHLVLPEIGEVGQRKLAQSSVLIVGVGGLGTAAAGYLAAMGIGRLGLIDPDRVEMSNLQRQLLFETADIGAKKVEAARDRLQEINPDCNIDMFDAKLTAANAKKIIAQYDMVADGCDNFATRFAVSDACFYLRKTLVSAAISGFAGQVTTFKAYLGAPHPCYRCFVSAMPEREVNCAQEGIVGALAGVAGSMQALEVAKELLGIGESLSGRVLIMHTLKAQYRTAALARDPACPSCGS